ncbi:MAG: precorrin-6y C5,15-methyltransferase (decarboxylating) subunit CbiE [Desulfosarcina sp.]|nr:precorrin-6y C5,15-methyltransferase (decarboxylating) subunit CbiE [Desulfosarcina sp.]MBC2744420.1 precorrin-6y C5,15-methyltransferase (decarboxylating) subunit CbiE [Desulfosarcina sp.]MBC2767328.1 precorrin-6y C5,15-methyltransferase (decarboxylating) subunit CbiE [Desulfosarcina sp.]
MAPPVTIIGMGVSPDDLTSRQRSTIEAADILVGGKRLIDHFGHLACQRRVIDRDLKGLGDFLQEKMPNNTIVVLTSGDPLFFGIGAFLARRLGAGQVHILPNISAVAVGFARLGEPWQDVRVVSLHGRNHTGELLRRLAGGDTVAVYTDPTHGPEWLADILVENAFSDVTMCVLERLGMEDEKITRIMPAEARAMTFSDLNLVVLKPDPIRQTVPALFPGMPDHRFAHEKGLITKAEVRAVSLSRLRLFDRAIFWDLGAGSGSVSIEAGLFIIRGEIYTVEQKAERIRQIRENRSRFGIGNMKVIHSHLPEGLARLPDPDRVFIGGGGKDLTDIIQMAANRLKPGGIIVVNTVLIANLTAATQALEDLGFNIDMIQIQVSRATPMPFSHRLEAANPVWIIAGSRP